MKFTRFLDKYFSKNTLKPNYPMMIQLKLNNLINRSLLLFLAIFLWSFSGYSQDEYSLDFGGTAADYVSIPDDDVFSFGNGTTDQPMSVEAWAKFDVVNLSGIVSKRSGAIDEWHMVISSGGDLSIYLEQQSTGEFISKSSSGFTFNTNQWYHLAFTYDGTGSNAGIDLYVDGVLLTTTTTGASGSYVSMENTASNVEIGTVDTGGNFNIDGQIDEVRIWNTERTSTQIAENYQHVISSSSSGLVGYYRLNEGFGTTANDLTTPANNGSLIGSPVWSTTVSNPENALDFDGTDDRVEITRTTLTSGLTFEAWINTTSTDATSGYAGNPALSVIGDVNNNIRGAFGIHGGVVRYTHWIGSGLVFDEIDGATAVNDGSWHHVAVSHNQSTRLVQIYVDGVLDGSGTTTQYDAVQTAFSRIGSSFVSSSDGDFFDGQIDEVRIWSTVRTNAEIDANATTSLTSGTGLVASYSFNHLGGETLVEEISPAALDGTWNDGAGGTNTESTYTESTALASTGLQDIFVSGNSVEISDGANSPNTGDDTDFGTQLVSSGNVINTFTVINDGLNDLAITSITSSNNTEFAVSSISASPIAPGASETFTVTFDPNASGTRTSTITINSDDPTSGEEVYTFAVSGIGTNPTSLTAGDVAFVAVSPSNETFAVVLLASVEAGTELAFSDNAWDGTGQRSGEGILTFTLLENITAGDILYVNPSGPTITQESDGSTVSQTVVTSGSLQINNSGDQVFAYQGDGSTASHYLSVINTNDAGFISSAPDAQTTQLPNTLISGKTAIDISPDHAVGDDAYYSSATVASTASGLRNLINGGSATNWTSTTSGAYDLTDFASVFTIDANTVVTSAHTSSSIGVGNILTFSASDFPIGNLQAGEALELVRSNVSLTGIFLDLDLDNTDDGGGETVGIGTDITIQQINAGYLKYQATTTAGNVNFGFLVSDGEAFVGAAYNNTIYSVENGLDFDGSDDFIEVGTGINTAVIDNATLLTVEAWVNLDQLGPPAAQENAIVSNSTTGVAEGFELTAYNGVASFTYRDNDNTQYTSGTLALTTGTWYHLAGVLDGTELSIYVNGIQSTVTTVPGGGIRPATESFKVGGNTSADGKSDGRIDEIRIWSVARTAAQIRANAASRLSNPVGETGLVAYYDFNAGIPSGTNTSTTTLTDLTGNGYDGTLSGTSFPTAGAGSNWIASGALTSTAATTGEIDISVGSISYTSGGAAFDFGSQGVGTNTDQVFTITNVGLGSLTGLNNSTLDVVDNTNYTLQVQPTQTTLTGGATDVFTVRFNPAALGAVSTDLGTTLTSSDSDENPFDLNLTGTGTAATPTLTTDAASSIGATTTDLNGTISSDGGSTITARGFVYALTSDDATPTIGEVGATVFQVVEGGTSAGSFSSALSGLNEANGYSFIAYATNGIGTTEGSVQTFTTLDGTAPVFTSNSVVAIMDTGADLTYNVDEGGDIHYSIHSSNQSGSITTTQIKSGTGTDIVTGEFGNFTIAGTGSDQTESITFAGSLTAGTYYIHFIAEDASTNQSIIQTVSFTADGTAPTPVITSASTSPTNDNPIVVNIDFSEAVNGFVSGDIMVGNGSMASLRDVKNYSYDSQFDGSDGGGDTFVTPFGIAIDNDGDIWVSDPNNAPNNIQQFDNTGNYIGPSISLAGAQGIAVDGSNNIYVAVQAQPGLVVKKYDNSGNPDVTLPDIGIQGTAAGQVNLAWDVEVDGSGNIFVVDRTNANWSIVMYDAAGVFVREIGSGQFTDTRFITTSGNTLYVADGPANNRISSFNTIDGSFITSFGSTGTGDGQFTSISGIDTDGTFLYVVDQAGYRIQVFTMDGEFVSKFGSQGSGDGQFGANRGVVVDASGNLLIADETNDRVQKLLGTGTGEFIAGITPSADGAVTVDIAASAASDLAGNNSNIASQFSVTYDGSAPVFASSSAAPVTNTGVNLTYNVGEAGDIYYSIHSSNQSGSITVAQIKAGSGANIVGTEFANFTIAGTGSNQVEAITFGSTLSDGTYYIHFIAEDAATNQSPVQTASFTIDATAPVATLAISGSPAANASILFVDVDFNEDANGVVIGDFDITPTGVTIGTAILTNDSDADDRTYQILIPISGGEGSVAIDLNATSGITDDLGNGNNSPSGIYATSAGSVNHTVDLVAPVATIAINGSPAVNATTILVDVDFDEDANGLVIGDFDITPTGVVLGATSLGIDGDSDDRTYQITIPITSGSGSISIDINATSGTTDDLGNGNNSPTGVYATSVASVNHTVDLVAPGFINSTPTLTQTGSDEVTVSFDLDENATIWYVVTDNAAAPSDTDVKAGAGGAGSVLTSEASIAYTTGSAATDVKGSLTMSDGTSYYAHLVVEDALTNQATSSTVAMVADVVDPTAAITYSVAEPYKSGDAVTITATFNEDMEDSPVPQLAITGSNAVTATNMTKVSATVYTYAHTVGAGDGTSTVSLSTGVDLAGNVITSAPTSGATFTVDNMDPTAAITYSVAGPYKSGDALTITATFNEDIADSPVPQIAITGSNTVTATNMTKVSATVYTYAHTVGTGDGTATVALSTGTDLAANVITSAPTSGADFEVDNTDPTAAITYSIAGPYKSGDAVTITATFNEDMADSPVPQIAITGSNAVTATNMTKVSATVYTYAHTVGAGDGTATVALSTGTDLAANVITSAPTSGATFEVDNMDPTAAITYSVAGPYKSGDAVTITATFNEDMADSPVPQIAITGSNAVTATNMTKISETVYTYAHTVGAGDGTATIALSTGEDLAGNLITSAPTGGATFEVDNMDPTAAITYSVAGPYKSGDAVTITATFNEDIADSPVPRIILSGVNAFAATDMTKVSATVYTYAHTVGAGDGTSTVSLSTGVDLAGNVITSAPTSGATFTVDNTVPTAAITYSSPGPYQNTDAVTITATFNEDMSDSPVPQIAITGSNTVTATNMTKVSATVYTYAHTVGTGDGTATVALSTGTDLAANLITSAPTSGADFEIDNTDPTAAITYSVAGSYQSGDAVTITATFDEDMADSPVPQIAITGSNAVAATNMTKVSATVYTYAHTVGAGDGTATVALSTGTDLAANVITSAPTSGATFEVDNMDPTAAITYSVAGPYKSGDAVTITATFNEDMADSPVPQIAITGSNAVTTTNMTKISATVYTYAHTVGAGDGTATIALSTGTDLAANVITSAPTSGATFEVDNTAPTVAITGPPATLATGIAIFTTTYVADVNSSTIDVLDYNIVTTGTVAYSGINLNTGGFPAVTYTVSGIIGTGTIGIQITAAGIQDNAGNNLDDNDGSVDGDITSAVYTIDNDASINISTVEGDDYINGVEDNTNVTISGMTMDVEATNGVNVSLFDGTNTFDPLGDEATVDGSGNWNYSFDITSSGLNEATITITVTTSDNAGNNANSTRDFVYDATAAIALDATLEIDNLINATEQSDIVITGTSSGIPDGTTVLVALSDNAGTPNTANTSATVNSNVWVSGTSDVSGFTEGNINISISSADIAGNSASVLSTSQLSIDRSASIATIVVTDDALGDDKINGAEAAALRLSGTTTGIQDAANITITLSDGTLSESKTVQISSNAWNTDDANPDFDISGFQQGPISIIATSTDVAGNVATLGKGISYDNSASITISTIEGDDRVNGVEAVDVLVSGTTIGVEDNQTVNLTFDDSNALTTAVTASAQVITNTWSTNLDLADISTLDDGSITVSAVVSDVVGNSANDSRNVTLDQGVAISIDLFDNAISGLEDNTVQVEGTTDAEDGRTVTLVFSDGSNEVTKSTTVVSGEWEFNTGNANTINVSGLDDGNALTLTATVQDVAGNAGSDVENFSLDKTASIGIDATLMTDNIISDSEKTLVEVSGTTIDVETGRTVTIVIDDSNALTAAVNANTTVQADGSWMTSSIDVSDLDDGTLSINASLTDVAGNPASATRNIEYDILTTITIGSPVTADELRVNADESEAFVISGSTTDVETGQSVSISFTDGLTTILASAVVSSGNWTSVGTDISSFPEGTLNVSVSVVDIAGNTSSSAAVLTLDKTVSISIDDPLEGDNVFNSTEIADVVISGQTIGVEDGQLVTVLASDGLGGIVGASPAVTSNTWFTTLNLTTLSEGGADIEVDVEDIFGNMASSEKTVEIDKSASLTIDLPIEDDNRVSLAESSTVVITGRTAGVESGQVVSLVLSDGSNNVNASATVSGSSWASSDIDISGLDEGNISVSASVTDVSLNPGSDSEVVVLDKTALITLAATIEGDNIINASEDGHVEVSGITFGVEDGRTVNVVFDDTNPITAAISASTTVISSAWNTSLDLQDISALDNGTITIAINTTDLSGNLATDVDNISLDNVLPLASIARSVPTAEFTNVTATTGVVYRVVFTEDVTGVDASDFAVVGPTGSSISAVSAISATIYDVTVDSYAADGSLDLDFIAIPTIADLANNPFDPSTGITSEQSYIIDLTQPTVVLSSNDTDAIVKDADLVTITATFVETNSFAANPTLSISGSLVTNAAMTATTDPKVWTYAWDVPDNTTADGNVTVSISVNDVAGNSNALATGVDTYEIDNTAPQVTSSTISSNNTITPATLAKEGNIVTVTIDFDEALFGNPSVSFRSGNVPVSNSVTVTDLGGDQYTAAYQISSLDIEGEVSYTISFADAAGNLGTTVTEPNSGMFIDKSATSAIISRSIPINQFTNVNGTTGVVFRVTFNEDVNGVGASDFAVVGPTGSSISSVSTVSTSVYDITVDSYSADGSLDLDFVNTPSITDLSNNAFDPSSGITGEES
ncbi:MAG: DUF1573 domain-containing protein, partial [Cyclobacteriaceae bacterium]